MACAENTRQIPINIETDDAKQYSRNLSQFLYDYKAGSSITLMQMNTNTKGAGYINIPDIQESFLNFTTTGNLAHVISFFFIDSLNYYNNKKMPIEIINVYKSKNGSDYLMMFIPVDIKDGTSASSSFFHSFIPLLTEKKEGEFYQSVVDIQGINYNNIIPRSHFMYYNAVFPHFGDCTSKIKMILYDTPIEIKQSDYDSLVGIFGKFTDNNMSSSDTNPLFNLNNFEKKHDIDYRMMFYNRLGTKRGPGRHTGNDVKELTCTPILDEEDKPIEGTRLDWIRQGLERGVSTELKNLFFVLILIAVTVGIIVTLHELAFKNLGKIIGDDSIIARSKPNL